LNNQGFGEEFGHRGSMFPLLYRIKPWIGFVGGGLIWYAWHWPLSLILPPAPEVPLWQTALSWILPAIGSIATLIYLAYAYVRSESIWVVSLAHIAVSNASRSFAYFIVLQDQLLANLELVLPMVLVVAVLYWTKELDIFKEYFGRGCYGGHRAPVALPLVMGSTLVVRVALVGDWAASLAALHGVLNKIRDLGVPLSSVRRLSSDEGNAERSVSQ
jgi:hypothetical protein